MFLHRLGKVRAPEFPSDLPWLNGREQRLRDLAGKVVLVDFWTYSCVNCLRTLPVVRRWHEKYSAHGLVIIGVHTPEFAFEQLREHVLAAIEREGVPYPVVQDNEYAIWHRYANKWWPHAYLIDHHGNIVYDHVGEGGYRETEMSIQKALVEAGARNLPALEVYDEGREGAVCAKTTPEVYLGYLRGRIGNGGNFLPDAEEVFTDPGAYTDDVPVLHGHWRVTGEYLEHTRTVPTPTEHLTLRYRAFGANLVMGTDGGERATLVVTLDGQPIPKDMAGADIAFENGQSTVTIAEHRLYRLTRADVFHHGTLRVAMRAAGVRLYAWTFEHCA